MGRGISLNAAKALIMVQDSRYVIARYTQASLRDITGRIDLDQLLVEREQFAQRSRRMSRRKPKAGGWR